VQLLETETGKRYSWDCNDYFVQPTLPLRLTTLQHSDDYMVRLTLDDQLAYANRFQEDDLPF
jgi:hypothetical protein